ncbi:MAG: Lrp/AsnC family transcriptional regulator [Planctomycetota bacterium]|jgi:DNA-binding Lrp family transcriptional regulator
MDEQDCKILNALQNNFPLCEGPYEVLARKLQMSSDELWRRIENLIADGVIRRIGVSLNSHKMGFCSTLAAVSVAADVVERACEIIGRLPEVTHSYLRADEFNIWFTIIAADEERVKAILEEIRSALSLEDSQVLNLPMERVFKLNARFDVSP